jgi:hypothetical protein
MKYLIVIVILFVSSVSWAVDCSNPILRLMYPECRPQVVEHNIVKATTQSDDVFCFDLRQDAIWWVGSGPNCAGLTEVKFTKTETKPFHHWYLTDPAGNVICVYQRNNVLLVYSNLECCDSNVGFDLEAIP